MIQLIVEEHEKNLNDFTNQKAQNTYNLYVFLFFAIEVILFFGYLLILN